MVGMLLWREKEWGRRGGGGCVCGGGAGGRGNEEGEREEEKAEGRNWSGGTSVCAARRVGESRGGHDAGNKGKQGRA